MPNIQIFSNSEFGEIRTVVIDGEPWFVAKEIARALGYARTDSAIRLVDDEDKRNICSADLGEQMYKQSYTIGVINESGLYATIFGSTLPSAKKFKKWVTSEVLPSIRKNGSYGRQLPQNPMELLELHYEAIRHVDNKVDALASDLEQFKQELPLFGIDEDRIVTAVHRKGVECLGGKDSNAYNDKSIHNKVFRDIYRELKHQFGISGTYKQLKRSQCDTAVRIIEGYALPIFLQEQVCDCNAQLNMGV